MQKVKITVRLDPDQITALDDVAREEGTTVSFLIRHLVRRFLESRRRLFEMPASAASVLPKGGAE